MHEAMFEHFPDVLKTMLNAHLHAGLKEVDKQVNFDELRRLAKEWVDELEKRFK